jgi:hypothetical protein
MIYLCSFHNKWLQITQGVFVGDGHTLESILVVQTPQNNNGMQEINTQYLCGLTVGLHLRD